MTPDRTAELIAGQTAGHSLTQACYVDPALYRREMDRIFLKSWLYAGHVSRLAAAGDYFLYELDTESVIIIRDGADTVRALLNLCRHRGSRICSLPEGRVRRLVCPYHAWTYGLDGSLIGANHAPPGFDKPGHGLRAIASTVFHGMIFINLDDDPVPFDPVRRDLDAPLHPYGLDRARIALRREYRIRANWKLAVENYCECYHCIPAHPEYSAGHGRALPREQTAELLEQVLRQAQRAGLTRDLINKEWPLDEDPGVNRGFDRYPLLGGHVTGSRDGRPLAPLLGDIRAYDGGATDIQIGPVTFFLAYCDHVVVYHFKPAGIGECICELTWLVHGAAEEGRDYRCGDLTWLWDVTTRADVRIIEQAQLGVNSRFYSPGPYTEMERFLRGFIHWYLHVMK